MKKSALVATAMVVGLGFATGGAEARPLVPVIAHGDHGVSIIYVGGKKNRFARELSRHLLIGALRTLPEAQDGELAACLDAADAEGLSPKKALRACVETLGASDGDFDADEELVAE